MCWRLFNKRRAFEGRILGVEKIFINSCSSLDLPGGLYFRGYMNCVNGLDSAPLLKQEALTACALLNKLCKAARAYFMHSVTFRRKKTFSSIILDGNFSKTWDGLCFPQSICRASF